MAATSTAMRAPRTTWCRSIGGRGMRLSLAGDALAERLLPAFGHLDETSAEPDFDLFAWTTEATGVAAPALPWSAQHVDPRGGVHALLEGPVRGCAAHDGSSLVLWDAERRTASCWWRATRDLPPWEAGAPLRTALHFALRSAERMLVHAACVGEGDRGVLLGGPGGSGKSTTTEACLRTGLSSAGDDYVVLDLAGGRPRAHTIYRTLKTSAALGRRGSDPRDDGRSTLVVGEDRAGTMTQSLQIVAVLVPTVTDAPASRLTAISPAAALRALAPGTLLQVPRERRTDLSLMSALVSAVPCFSLALGRDRGVPAIESLLEQRAP